MNTAAPRQALEILLIEDNPGDIRLTREVLEAGPIANHLSVVRDGEQALDYLFRRAGKEAATRPDLILLDLNLPRRSGMEVLSEIKRDTDLRRIPVIILSSSKSEREINQSYDLYANCYIAKPVGLDRFTEVIRSIEQFWLGVVQLPAR